MNLYTLVLNFAFLLFGIGILVRVSAFFQQKQLIKQDMAKKIFSFYVVLLLFFSVFAPINPVNSFLLLISSLIFLLIYVKFRQFKLKRQYFSDELHVVRCLSLQISSGLSLIDAISNEVNKQDNKIALSIYDFVTFRQHLGVGSQQEVRKDLLLLLKNLLENPINANERLKAFEEKLQIEHDFRRRSGQTLLGVRIQAIIMAVLYLVAAIYTLSFYNFSKNKSLILLSLLMFLTGSLWLLNIGKKIKWKV